MENSIFHSFIQTQTKGAEFIAKFNKPRNQLGLSLLHLFKSMTRLKVNNFGDCWSSVANIEGEMDPKR